MNGTGKTWFEPKNAWRTFYLKNGPDGTFTTEQVGNTEVDKYLINLYNIYFTNPALCRVKKEKENGTKTPYP